MCELEFSSFKEEQFWNSTWRIENHSSVREDFENFNSLLHIFEFFNVLFFYFINYRSCNFLLCYDMIS